MSLAAKYLKKLSYVKDTRILIGIFPLILFYNKAPKLKLSSSKINILNYIYRNFQPFGVFCSLNLGVSGLIRDSESLDYMRANFKVGDIIDVLIAEEFDSALDFDTPRPLVILTLPS